MINKTIDIILEIILIQYIVSIKKDLISYPDYFLISYRWNRDTISMRAHLFRDAKINRGKYIFWPSILSHNYSTLPINQANLNRGFDHFTISRLFFEPVNFLSLDRQLPFPEGPLFKKRYPPRPLLDVPRDAPPARTVTEVDLSSSSSPPLPAPLSCPNWSTPPPPLRGHSSPNRCCIPKKPRSHCATNRKSSVGLRAGRFEKFHRQAL